MDKIKLNQMKIVNVGVVVILTATIGYISYSSSQIKQENYKLQKKTSGQTIMIDRLNDANLKIEGQKSKVIKEKEVEKSKFEKSIEELKKQKQEETSDLNDRLYKANQEYEELKVSKAKAKRDEASVLVASRGGGSNATPSANNTPKQVKQEDKSEVKVAEKQEVKQIEQPKQEANASPQGGWMNMNASAYSTDGNDSYVSSKWGGKTASGNYPTQGRDVAVSNSQFKRGTRLELKFPSGYEHLNGSNYIASDTGNWISHGKIDIFMNSTASCNSFGRRTIQARVVQ